MLVDSSRFCLPHNYHAGQKDRRQAHVVWLYRPYCTLQEGGNKWLIEELPEAARASREKNVGSRHCNAARTQ